MKYSVCQIGNFLSFDLWKDAKRLLDFQINQIDQNKHYCTLSMFYYRKVLTSTNKVGTKEYFENRVANGLFYALEREFNFCDYVIPKSHLGLRNQKFFTYPMRVLCYSIGLYLLKLSQDFIKHDLTINKRIKSYYGGDLYFEQNSLVVKHKTTFYKQYYQEFKREIRKQVNKEPENKLIIKVDIQNFFDNISIPHLIKNLNTFVKPSLKEELNFDILTQEQIIFFYSYISRSKGGIPQSDNDIISSFIGYLYLTFGDLEIDS